MFFCYNNSILKTKLSVTNTQYEDDNTTTNIQDLDTFETYELGSIMKSEDYIQQLKCKISKHYQSLPKFITIDVDEFIQQNEEKILLNEYKDNISVLFDILKLKYGINLEFVGFSLPTTFNKHKDIFVELQNFTAENSIKLNDLIKLLIKHHTTPDEDMLKSLRYDKRKIKINQKLNKLNSRFDRVRTVVSEIYPSNDQNIFGTFMPTKIKAMLDNQIISIDNIICANDNQSLNKFYSVKADKLNLYEDIKLSDMHIGKDTIQEPVPYSQSNFTKINSTTENMLNMSANYSLLFGVIDELKDWIQVNNFNLFRNKIPVRYYFKLDRAITIGDITYKYIFFDFNGEFIDISIPLLGDSNYREDIHGDEAKFKKYTEELTIFESLVSFVKVNTLSLEYNILDNFKMIFMRTNKIPWDQPKHEKRLMRLILLLLIELKDEYDQDDRIEIFNHLKRHITSFINQYTHTGSISSVYKANYKTTFKNNKSIISFIDYIYTLHTIIRSEGDKAKMIKFLNTINCYMEPEPVCLTNNSSVKDYKPIQFLTSL